MTQLHSRGLTACKIRIPRYHAIPERMHRDAVEKRDKRHCNQPRDINRQASPEMEHKDTIRCVENASVEEQGGYPEQRHGRIVNDVYREEDMEEAFAGGYGHRVEVVAHARVLGVCGEEENARHKGLEFDELYMSI